MARAIVARRQGDDFQARLFWLRAACLLDPQGSYEKVIYEKGPKGLDDIVVEYEHDKAPRHVDGEPVLKECFQCKWHTTANDFGYEDLIDPSFINATSQSFLQNVRAAQDSIAPEGKGYRFHLITNWTIRSGDTLSKILRREQNCLDIDRLFSGGPRSAVGKLRLCWQNHLDIDEDELRLVARVLSITERTEPLNFLRERLDDRFAAMGMRRIPAGESAYIYDDLAQKLLAQGRVEFDRNSFREMCRDEGLLEEKSSKPESITAVGVRSFLHSIDPLEDRCERVLDLVEHFDGRAIRDDALWNERIYPDLKEFLIQAAKTAERLRLSIDAHVSVAFAAGAVLNVKSGREVGIEQRSNGRQYWSRKVSDVRENEQGFICEVEDTGKTGKDVAVAISLTHDVSGAVRPYVEATIDARSLVVCAPEGGPSYQAVHSGAHAWNLAEQLVGYLRNLQGSRCRIHLFLAGPNGFAFFLGQMCQGLGPLTVYEFEFDRGPGGTYRPGIALG